MSGTNTTIAATGQGPRVSGPVRISLFEDGALGAFDPAALLANAVDFDPGAFLSVIDVRLVAPDGTAVPAALDAAGRLVLDPSGPVFQALGQGQALDVTVDYGITDGVNTVAAQAVFHVTGVNDAPVVDGPAGGMVVNDGGAAGAYDLPALLARAHDPDQGDHLSVVIDPVGLPEGVSFTSSPEHVIPGHVIPAQFIPAGPRGTTWGNYVYPATVIPAVVVPDQVIPATTVLTLDPSNAAYRSLAQGEERNVVVHYQVTDGITSTQAEAVFTVNGMNDAPVVSGPASVAGVEDGAPLVVDALANATDADHGTVLSVVAAPQVAAPPLLTAGIGDPSEIEAEAQAATAAAGAAAASTTFDLAALPAGVTYDAATHGFSLDPANAAYQSLAAGQTKTVTVNYGVSDGITTTAASVTFTVTGTNDAPVVSGPATGVTVTEDGAAGLYDHAALIAHASDVDATDTLDVRIDDTKLPAGVVYHHVPGTTISVGVSTTYYGAITSFVDVRVAPVDTLTLDAGNPAYQSLALGETMDVAVDYAVTDGIASTPTKAIFHVVGANDAPVVAGSVVAQAVEDGGVVTSNGLGQATDVDHGAMLTVVAAPPPAVAGELNLSRAGVNETAAAPPPPILPFDPTGLPAGVGFDAATNSFSLDPANAAYQSLAAGQTTTVTVQYGVSDGMANTPASVTFTVTGTNDAPVVSGPVTLAVTARSVPLPAPTNLTPADKTAAGVEDALPPWVDVVTAAGIPAAQAAHSVLLLANATDIDQGNTLSVVGLQALPPGISHIVTAPYYTPSPVYYGAPILHPGVDALLIDPSDASFASLAAGETKTITVNYGVSDGTVTTPASAVFTVTGTNDAPVVSGTAMGAATEDGAVVRLDGLAMARDVDHGAVLSVTNVPAVLPAGIGFDAATNSFSIDPANAAYQLLGAGQTTTVTVNYAVSDGFVSTPASAAFVVTGVNDAPIVSAPLSYAVTATTAGIPPVAPTPTPDATARRQDVLPSWVEASLTAGGLPAAQTANSVYMLAHASDVDQGDTLSVTGLPAVLPAGISYVRTPGYYTPSPVYYGAPVFHPGFDLLTIDPSNAAFRGLAAGETATYMVNYGITDGRATTPASASFTVTGVNDAPVVVTPVTMTSEDAGVSSIALLATASDPDHGSVVSLASVQAVLPAGITYDAASQTLSLDPGNAAFQGLAQNQMASYAVSFSVTDGQLVTPANAIFLVRGVNDAPIVTGPMLGTANEDGVIANIDPFLSVTDIDTPLESLRVTGLPASLTAGVSFNAASQKFFLNPSNAAYQSLSLGETKTVSIAFGITDGYATVPATAVFTVTGRNDAPVVTGSVSGGTTTAQGAPVTLNLLANASDIDHLDTLAVTNASGAEVTASVTSGAWTAPVAFTVANNQLTLDPKQFATLPLGNTVGVTFNYQVTDGNPGGSVATSATVAIQGTYAPVAPKGVTMADATASLAKAQAGSGINSKVAVASFAQTGGVATDTYAYTLGGAGAGSFTLATAGGVATLSSGSSGAAGSAAGQLYALTVTATDTTNGLAAPPTPVDVVVGAGKGGNTITLASLPSMVSTRPTFIYDLGGSDTINGAGMKGALWFDGGQGADTMTGGAGVNTYLYGATTDSTATAMDIITNFHVGVDLIDLTGTGARFATVGALASTATTIGAGAIGWQTSGGNTFVYANTGANSQNLTAAAMKIELVGAAPLSGSSFAHL